MFFNQKYSGSSYIFVRRRREILLIKDLADQKRETAQPQYHIDVKKLPFFLNSFKRILSKKHLEKTTV